MALFEIENLNFSYQMQDEKALCDINLNIEKGSYNLILGKSGSGKTTLLKCLKPVLLPAGNLNGEILYKNKNINDVDDISKAFDIGFVMQDPDSQIVTDVVWHELSFGLENAGYESSIIKRKVAEVAAYFGIEDWFDKEISCLSGGQKQILNLASIMAMDPSVLILDEPVSELDPISANNFLDIIKKINKEFATTIILSEHRPDEIFPVANNVIVMDCGKVIASGAPEKICKELHQQKNELFHAMPAPARVYLGVSEIDNEKIPLTVNEGRAWIEEYLGQSNENTTHNVIYELNKENTPNIIYGANDDVLDIKNNENDSINKNSNDNKAISIKNLFFRYNKNDADILKGLNLDIDKGIIYALTGGNGSGKTTLLNVICKNLKPLSGKIFINGKRSDNLKRKKFNSSKLAMLPQDVTSLFVKSNVLEELLEMFCADERSALNEEDNNKLNEMISFCGLDSLLERHPFDLSGGEQQKVALAKVLLLEPDIILMDEPTKCIDISFKMQLANMLQELKKSNKSIFIVSHDLEFCAKYADKVGMIFDGQIITSELPCDFFSENKFYTTSAAAMSRNILNKTVTADDIINKLT